MDHQSLHVAFEEISQELEADRQCVLRFISYDLKLAVVKHAAESPHWES